jgi:hypothetical protein
MNREPDFEVMQILQLVRLCQATGTLPESGGLLDQDSYFIFLLETVLGADAERAERERPKT